MRLSDYKHVPSNTYTQSWCSDGSYNRSGKTLKSILGLGDECEIPIKWIKLIDTTNKSLLSKIVIQIINIFPKCLRSLVIGMNSLSKWYIQRRKNILIKPYNDGSEKALRICAKKLLSLELNQEDKAHIFDTVRYFHEFLDMLPEKERNTKKCYDLSCYYLEEVFQVWAAGESQNNGEFKYIAPWLNQEDGIELFVISVLAKYHLFRGHELGGVCSENQINEFISKDGNEQRIRKTVKRLENLVRENKKERYSAYRRKIKEMLSNKGISDSKKAYFNRLLTPLSN